MNSVPDRQKQRREYLRKQVLGYGKGEIGVLLYALGSVLCPLSGCFAILLVLVAALLLSVWSLVLAVVLAGTAVATARLAGWGWRLLGGFDAASNTPYVPPVTPDTLPAEEVLVRGSVEPDAPQETLLRAVQSDEETKQEELLRSHLP